MEMIDFKDLFFKKITVTLKDGEKITGVLTGVENDFDTNSGKEEIELAVDDYDIGLEIAEIESVQEGKPNE